MNDKFESLRLDRIYLKPCPFCGGDAQLRMGNIHGRKVIYPHVEHDMNCFFGACIYAHPVDLGWTAERVANGWNMRMRWQDEWR